MRQLTERHMSPRGGNATGVAPTSPDGGMAP